MKVRILSLLPNRWSEGSDIRAMLLALIVVVGALFLNDAYEVSEGMAFLLSGFLAILAVYWLPPLPEESYVRWIVSNSMLLFSLFIFLFMIPLIVSSFVAYRSAQVLSIVVFGVCYWFLIRLKKKVRRQERMRS